jgi:predicted dehydrogenase
MAREYARNTRTNVSRFIRADFHDDSGLKHLVEAFYRSIIGEAPLPISYREILLTARLMDAIFKQVASESSQDVRRTTMRTPQSDPVAHTS